MNEATKDMRRNNDSTVEFQGGGVDRLEHFQPFEIQKLKNVAIPRLLEEEGR